MRMPLPAFSRPLTLGILSSERFRDCTLFDSIFFHFCAHPTPARGNHAYVISIKLVSCRSNNYGWPTACLRTVLRQLTLEHLKLMDSRLPFNFSPDNQHFVPFPFSLCPATLHCPNLFVSISNFHPFHHNLHPRLHTPTLFTQTDGPGASYPINVIQILTLYHPNFHVAFSGILGMRSRHHYPSN